MDHDLQASSASGGPLPPGDRRDRPEDDGGPPPPEGAGSSASGGSVSGHASAEASPASGGGAETAGMEDLEAQSDAGGPAWLRGYRPEQVVTGALTAIGVIVAMAFVWLQMQPGLVWANTLAAGGDMGAHVWGPDYLRRELLPRWRLAGWTPDWYAGFPAYHFYMVVPPLLVVLLDVLPGLSYERAFKLVTVSGMVTLPLAAYAMGRLFRLRFPGPALLAFATLPFLFDTRFTIYGGNAASTLAGEFAFSISLSIAVVYLGVVHRGLETGRYRALGAGLFALVILCHLIPALFAVAGTVVLGLWHLWPSWRSTLAWVVPVGIVGAVASGFWSLPFLARHAYFNDMGWERLQTFGEHLGPRGAIWSAVFLLAIAGVVMSIIERNRLGGFLTSMVVVSGGLFVIWPQTQMWNARFLPFYYLSLYLLAGLGVALLVGLLPSLGARAVAGVGAAAVVLVAVGLPLGVVPGSTREADGRYAWLGMRTTASFVDDWARWNYSGYQGKPAWPEYSALIGTMAAVGEEHGCGRAMWEYDSDRLNSYGTPMALMLLPYWTDSCIGSMEGLYFESSATTPFHFLNQAQLSANPSSAQRNLPYRGFDFELGIRHLQLMGVRYYMAVTDRAKEAAAAHEDLLYLESSGPWDIYEVLDSELVEPLAFQPAILTGVAPDQDSWLPVATAWYNDPTRWDVPLVAGGPARRADAGSDVGLDRCQPGRWQEIEPDTQPERCPVDPAVVSDIEAGIDTISFRVDRVGVPVMVKASYFPNWKVSGGLGPFRVTPNLMVVVPTTEEVRLRYGRTPVDWAGMGLSAMGAAGIALLAWRPALRVRHRQPRPRPVPEIDLSRYQLHFPDAAPAGAPAGAAASSDAVVRADVAAPPGGEPDAAGGGAGAERPRAPAPFAADATTEPLDWSPPPLEWSPAASRAALRSWIAGTETGQAGEAGDAGHSESSEEEDRSRSGQGGAFDGGSPPPARHDADGAGSDRPLR